MSEKNPLKIYCESCGAPLGFDIVKQSYRCTSCMSEEKAESEGLSWRKINGQDTSVNKTELESYSCSSCGAQIVFAEGEASETCDFCGSRLIRNELVQDTPDLIIPFYITYDEARKRMLDWGHEHQKSTEGKSVVSSMGNFKAYYLPYQFVRGSVHGDVLRADSERTYHCAGFVEGCAVNTSKQLPNSILNMAEPFDWSAAKPFEFGYIAGHNVKLRDISDAQTEERTLNEVTADFLPDVKRAMKSRDVNIKLKSDELNAFSVLLPMYFIRSGKLTAVMNGQTGRIAVAKETKKKSNLWYLKALIYTLIITIVCVGTCSIFMGKEALSLIQYCVGFFGIVLFAAMSQNKKTFNVNVVKMSKETMAERKNGKLEIVETENILKNPFNNTPVFFEEDETGKSVPVKFKFFSFARFAALLAVVSATVMLPDIVALIIRLCQFSASGKPIFENFNIVYGFPWYIVAGIAAALFSVKAVDCLAFEFPILYQILENGKKRRIRKRKVRKMGVFQKTKRFFSGIWSFIKDIHEIGGIFYFGIVFLIFIFVMSVITIAGIV